MVSWPASFPQPKTSLSVETSANTVRTQMDSGAVRQRRRFTTEQSQVNITWEMPDVQGAVFISFHKNSINLGADWFLMPLSLGGGLRDHEVRFVDGKYSQSYADVGYWTFSAKLDIRQRYTYSDSVLSIYLTLGLSEAEITILLDSMENFHQCVHHTLPNELA